MSNYEDNIDKMVDIPDCEAIISEEELESLIKDYISDLQYVHYFDYMEILRHRDTEEGRKEVIQMMIDDDWIRRWDGGYYNPNV